MCGEENENALKKEKITSLVIHRQPLELVTDARRLCHPRYPSESLFVLRIWQNDRQWGEPGRRGENKPNQREAGEKRFKSKCLAPNWITPSSDWRYQPHITRFSCLEEERQILPGPCGNMLSLARENPFSILAAGFKL